MTNLSKLLKPYDYHLPRSLIAQTPACPRDHARLLVYPHTKEYKKWLNKQTKNFSVEVYDRFSNGIRYDRFCNLGKYLPKNAVLVFNQTRVIPARLTLKKDTGGKVEILYLGADADTRIIKILSNKKLIVGPNLLISSKNYGRNFLRIFKVVEKEDNVYLLKTDAPHSALTKLFKKYGQTPLPPYLKNSPLNEAARRRAYQTIFARTGESVAAPTASLHFTKRLLKKLRQKGIIFKFINLDVNLGTFAPLKKENFTAGKLHAETYAINKSTMRFIKQAKHQDRPIIAVGTTVARALESGFEKPRATKLKGNTRLFIRPPYQFKIVSGIITNFHVPKSSLMMLVAAFMGRKFLLDTYQKAIRKRFRFFSFGDGMLIL